MLAWKTSSESVKTRNQLLWRVLKLPSVKKCLRRASCACSGSAVVSGTRVSGHGGLGSIDAEEPPAHLEGWAPAAERRGADPWGNGGDAALRPFGSISGLGVSLGATASGLAVTAVPTPQGRQRQEPLLDFVTTRRLSQRFSVRHKGREGDRSSTRFDTKNEVLMMAMGIFAYSCNF